ncbi:unnamed protein product [Lactuca saligna]|uniref:Uncharacterized protein n=1 Tax=Lactuca saligna TaxID=75948 RepID=A0AA35UVC7_LACSI|nr:unnamed protein product [Lactuca saligna]
MLHVNRRIMEVNKEQHEDMTDYDMEYEQHDGTIVYDSYIEDGEHKDIDYNSHSDSEEEFQSTVPTSYLGDLVCEKVGLSALCWKKVKPEVKDKLWEEITHFSKVDETGKQFVMNRLGILLWNFIRKLTTKARKMSKYVYRMGRGEYTTLRQKLIEEKVISKEEIPPKGVGTGVTYNRYFNVPRSKGSSNEEIKDLKVALHNGKLELRKKDVELKDLSIKVNEQDQTLKLVLAHLNAKGVDFPNLSHTTGISSEKIVESSETPVTLKTKEPFSCRFGFNCFLGGFRNYLNNLNSQVKKNRN